MEWYHYVIALVGSALAGGINTLAGNGSAITLTILTELIGLPGNMANATNRIGIFTQSAAGFYVFRKNGRLDFSRTWYYILFMVIGSLAGIWVAIRISNEQFISVFRFLMVFMLFVILIKPERWLRATDTSHQAPLWIVIPSALALGFYGGFIQMGMGIFFLAAMVLGARYSLTDANAVKITVAGIYTFIAILVFMSQGLIRWEIGLVMAVGQSAGGYFTAQYATRSEKANLVAHRVLVIMVILAVIKLFNLHQWILG